MTPSLPPQQPPTTNPPPLRCPKWLPKRRGEPCRRHVQKREILLQSRNQTVTYTTYSESKCGDSGAFGVVLKNLHFSAHSGQFIFFLRSLEGKSLAAISFPFRRRRRRRVIMVAATASPSRSPPKPRPQKNFHFAAFSHTGKRKISGRGRKKWETQLETPFLASSQQLRRRRPYLRPVAFSSFFGKCGVRGR